MKQNNKVDLQNTSSFGNSRMDFSIIESNKLDQIQINKLDRFGLNLSLVLKQKYQFNNIINEFNNHLYNVDLRVHKSPFLPQTLEILRIRAYNQLKSQIKDYSEDDSMKLQLKFIKKVDQHSFMNFKSRMKENYFTMIIQNKYNLPFKIDNKLCQMSEFNQLAMILANWSVEVEVFYDIVQRSILYSVYSNSRSILISQLRSKFGPQTNQSYLKCSLEMFKKLLFYMTSSLSTKIYEKETTILKNHVYNWTMISILCQFIGTHQLSQSLIQKLGLFWIIGGCVFSTLMHRILVQVQKYDNQNQIQYFTQTFEQVHFQLQKQNEDLNLMLYQIIQTKDSKQKSELIKQFNTKIQNFIDNPNLENKDQNQQNQSKQMSLIETIIDGDWVVLQKQNMKEELIDEGFIKYG